MRCILHFDRHCQLMDLRKGLANRHVQDSANLCNQGLQMLYHVLRNGYDKR